MKERFDAIEKALEWKIRAAMQEGDNDRAQELTKDLSEYREFYKIDEGRWESEGGRA